ncbi:hypothetical protein HYW21_08305 [Candidatus Woesearchaeota archaeon]|nr:hypothetical protein [Candidatus Woesearchaeota archaeon]
MITNIRAQKATIVWRFPHDDDDDPDIYGEDTVLDFCEDDMISDSEEGFMQGYLSS